MTTLHDSETMSYVDTQAEIGVTKHSGGWEATHDRWPLCQLGAAQCMGYVLLVGRK